LWSGGAPGTHETDLLKPENTITNIHAIVLSGESAFGLSASQGVIKYPEENDIGYDTGFAKVPIVPDADIRMDSTIKVFMSFNTYIIYNPKI